MSKSLTERLAVISVKIFAIGTVNGIKKLEDLSAELNSLSADIAQRDWHTGTPTENGWYLLECRIGNSGGTYYDIDHWNNVVGYWTVNRVIRWQKIEPHKEEKDE